jgi:hypothetical protein
MSRVIIKSLKAQCLSLTTKEFLLYELTKDLTFTRHERITSVSTQVLPVEDDHAIFTVTVIIEDE